MMIIELLSVEKLDMGIVDIVDEEQKHDRLYYLKRLAF